MAVRLGPPAALIGIGNCSFNSTRPALGPQAELRSQGGHKINGLCEECLTCESQATVSTVTALKTSSLQLLSARRAHFPQERESQ